MSTRMLALREAIFALRGGPGDGVERFGQRAERLGPFRLILKYPFDALTAFVRVRRSQNAVSGSEAVPRGSGVALAACRALTFGTRRAYNSNNKIRRTRLLLFVRLRRPLVSLRMPSIGHTDLIQTLCSAARLSGPC